MNSIKVIIVAAGSGSRFGSSLPKQFCILSGRPVVMMTIDRFRHALPNSEIILVISRQMSDLWREQCSQYDFMSPEIVYGGDSRAASVKNALDAISGDDNDMVLVHDGARPLVDEATIMRVVDRLSDKDVSAVIPVVNVTDSLRMLSSDGSSQAVDRGCFRMVQTPQGFRLDDLRKAYMDILDSTVTDDASAMERAGNSNIVTVDGNPENIKITHPFDIAIAMAIIGHKK